MKINYNYLKKQNLNIIQNYTFKNEVESWYQKTIVDPTAKNSAVFYGQGGTGKTSLAHLVAKETDKPLFVCYANSALETNFNDKLEGMTAKDKFKQLITEIEAGIYDNGVEKIKTEADQKGYILLIEWAERTSEWNFLQESSKEVVKDPNKNALYIFLTDLKSHKELEETNPYLYKSNLNEVFFSFQLPFIKTLLEKEEVNMPNSFPNILYGSKTIDLIWHFTFFSIKDFAKFWQEHDISSKLSNTREVEKELTKWLEQFWLEKDKHWFDNEYKITEDKKQKKIIEALENKIAQNRGDLLMLYHEVGFLRKNLPEKK
ncbi:AAA family ATPase [endosymbiont GvMRE of Glomus versiforme]|uniref:AAA family ATPase n=1 Tax=endosymbiont GvMRE of Glomus versiforme TaxID=2039283 RepID=UPI000ECB0C6B|nr:AAA family ATPase [endosymbiont GvMRE of Glomus versiforme]RHZ35555.1 Cell division protein FtsH [endosymbiont GvMRE of Glomus versiforme]